MMNDDSVSEIVKQSRSVYDIIVKSMRKTGWKINHTSKVWVLGWHLRNMDDAEDYKMNFNEVRNISGDIYSAIILFTGIHRVTGRLIAEVWDKLPSHRRVLWSGSKKR